MPRSLSDPLKHKALTCAEMMIGEGKSLRGAANALGLPVSTLSRWIKEVNQLEKPNGRPGRPPKFTLTPEEEAALQSHVLIRGGLPLAVEDFMRDPACQAETREALAEIMDAAAAKRRLPSWPMSLRRLARVTPEQAACFRGPKAAQDFAMVQRRGLSVVLEDGTEVPLLPGMIFESDDMSVNEPYRYQDPVSGEWKTGRQTLISLDVYSAKFLSLSMVGRDRDAYRGEDISDHMLNTVQAHGLPVHWRLERGAWENNFIDGVPLDGAEAARLGLDIERFRGKRWGGISSLVNVIRAFASRQKGTVEKSFDRLQSVSAHRSLHIGRVRGEFEAATAVMRKAQRGHGDALALLWDINAAADAVIADMERCDARAMLRRAFGRDTVVPEELWREHQRRECPPTEIWRFGMAAKRFATVRQGRVEVSLKHWPRPFAFAINGQTPDFFEHGYRVLIAFHPGHPERGCIVANAETGTRNRRGWSVGEVMFLAPAMADAPQIDLSGAYAGPKKAADAAMRSEFRAVRPGGLSADPLGRGTGARVSLGRDGISATLAAQRGIAPLDGPGSDAEPVKPARKTAPLPPPERRNIDAEALARKEREAADFF